MVSEERDLTPSKPKAAASRSNDTNLAAAASSNCGTRGGVFIPSYRQPHSTPRSIIRLNNLVNLNSNSVSWGSTPRSGSTGRTHQHSCDYSIEAVRFSNQRRIAPLITDCKAKSQWVDRRIRLCFLPLKLIEIHLRHPDAVHRQQTNSHFAKSTSDSLRANTFGSESL